MAVSAQQSTTFLVFALRPCSVLNQLILEAKSKTTSLAGPQTYLDHPPHLTLYVAAFDDPTAVADELQRLVQAWTPPIVRITGWHYFEGDVLTGRQTLVCEIHEDDKTKLRDYQTELISHIASMRNEELSLSRYLPHFSGLATERQQAVRDVGFPFIRNDWIPHFTVASIDPSKWDIVWQELEPSPPRGSFRCAELEIFELVNDYPTEWRSIRFDNDLSATRD